jgi:lycopene cyclase domain-containing protein
MEYIAILVVLFSLGLYMEHRWKIHLYESRRERVLVVLIFFLIGVLWDTFAIWRGHWYFNEEKLIGVTIGLMPLEEYLFILIVPFWIITTYKVLTKIIK